ncbi:MAG TPA: glycosyltransferase family 4 protein [Acidimicrobiales bacterium]|nr:glycosyltransferase family 4 protein [Acidimicrobiales bacterium]
MTSRTDTRLLGKSPLVVHVTTTDISLALLLGPQLKAFSDAGYEVIGASAPGPFVVQIEADGIPHVALEHASRSIAPRDDLLAAQELYRLFRQLRPDIVHTHNPKPGVYGRIAARAARVPAVVNTVHGLYATSDDRIGRRAVVYALERVAASCSDAELVQNPEDIETLASLRVPRSRLTLLGNGVDLDRFRRLRESDQTRKRIRSEIGVGEDEVVVGAIGRLVWEKGYAELFAAAAALREDAPGVRVVVVGPEEPGKADAIRASDIAKAEAAGVQFLGYRSDVDDVYAALDIYVLASYREGFPRSAMEAAAMGLPIVATDIRGCRQVVDDGLTGLLVPPRASHALTRAIARLAADDGMRRSMGERARVKAEAEFDQRRVIGITLDVYAELLARKGYSPLNTGIVA